jgi:hypothetical protein
VGSAESRETDAERVVDLDDPLDDELLLADEEESEAWSELVEPDRIERPAGAAAPSVSSRTTTTTSIAPEKVAALIDSAYETPSISFST